MKVFCGFALFLLFITHIPAIQENQNSDNKPETPTKNARRIKVGGDEMRKKLTHKVTPLYPMAAMNHHISGTVVLRVVIGIDGTVKEMEYVSGSRALLQATLDGVKQYRYKPTTDNGEPVEVETTVETVFELRQ
jgi:periplasmic protein TonB